MDSDRSTLSGNSPRTKVHISRSGSIAIRNDGPPSPTRMSPQKSPSKKNIAGLKDAVNSLRIKAIRQYRTNESSKIVAADLGGATHGSTSRKTKFKRNIYCVALRLGCRVEIDLAHLTVGSTTEIVGSANDVW